MIPVTKTFFPPIEEYNQHLQRIWKYQWLTNRGELVKELETNLKTELGVTNITLTTNGTLPIQIALKVLAAGGEVITTPFSYVATTSAIVWENCKPVFVDIHPEYLTIDETKIEAAITPQTKAILATHVFGNPCHVEEIERIAQKYDLKVIYDAAHCFGVKYKGESIFNYGDVSTCSFHATKLFHTGEGGAMFCKDEELNHQLFYSHNFGHNGPEDFYGVGINAKMSELQAAMGLSVLPYMNKILEARKKIVDFYNENLDFSKLQKLKIREGTNCNNSYYPVTFENEETLLKVQRSLNEKEIYPRRYFYPSLNTLSYIDYIEMPVSEAISSRVLCLPLYAGLKPNELKKIVELHNLG
ncbi:dTDP-4-amino-4,6-dideoxygalactose transaminase [Salegentibacter agarivorans]|uniref:dTDP-4-amino-4,6-dideoxygalactose transaminase n=1 Tax=Salegentibacter agarivorans TaxID=345907 RepID=A0A1I2JZ53_9FLAO|nr:DegT/DnrJ/EryC1/StrS family aminotransferase [Salegentibacter agarivorans]SFF60155.1 dTDP-4-amino-4,6-dideoxygalactose transaminase [Salegentibacter agarivorans]